MKEIIFIDNKNEIPKDYSYDTETDDFWVYRHKYTGDEIHITKEPPLYVNAIPIPDNATNGDVIKTVFPNFEFYPVEHMSKLCSPQIKGLGTSGYFEMGFDLEWWNSPYKADKESD